MKAKRKNLLQLQRRNCSGYGIPVNGKSICMSCFVHFGLAQKMDIDMLHYQNCSKEHCFKCEYAFIKALWSLDYKQTQMGNWYRRTPDPKIVRIYDDLLTNLPTYSVSRLEGKL